MAQKIMTKQQFVQWRTRAKKPTLTAAQLDGRYKAYVTRMKKPAAAKKKVTPNLRPDGWAMEGARVTPGNRHIYPESRFELVEGKDGSTWARPRTELTGIDPELRGQVKTYDDETGRMTGQVQRVYDALGQQLTSQAQASTNRLGGLADLATRAQPASFQSAGVTSPSGDVVQAQGPGAEAGVTADMAATQQRMLTRNAALDVNTANLDAQQAPQIGAREIARLTGDRTKGRGELIKGLQQESRRAAEAAREAKMRLLGQQLSSETDMKTLEAKLRSQESIAAGNAASRERIAGQNNMTKAQIEEARLREKQAAAAAKPKPAAKSGAAYEKKKTSWLNMAKGYEPSQGGPSKILQGTFGGTVARIPNDPNGGWELKPGLTTVDEFFEKGVMDGVRPSDMIRILRAGGVNLTATNMLSLLRRHLPTKNAQAVVNQIVGHTIRWS